MRSDFIYEAIGTARPRLAIENGGGASLGPCYSSSTWIVTSAYYPLTVEQLEALFQAGVLGVGQDFRVVREQGLSGPPACTIIKEPTRVVEYQDGKRITPPGERAINPYSREPYPDSEAVFYQYTCVTTCDSGD